MTKDRLAELLIKTGMLSKENLDRASQAQKSRGGDMGRILVEMGMIAEETLVRAYATLYSMQAVSLTPKQLDADVAKLLPKEVCDKWGVIPFRVDQGRKYLDVAQSDPTNLDATDEIRRVTRYTVRFFLATAKSILESLNYAYYSGNLDNVGHGQQVEFGADGMASISPGYEAGTVPAGGPSFQGDAGIPVQGADDMATFQPMGAKGGVGLSDPSMNEPDPEEAVFEQNPAAAAYGSEAAAAGIRMAPEQTIDVLPDGDVEQIADEDAPTPVVAEPAPARGGEQSSSSDSISADGWDLDGSAADAVSGAATGAQLRSLQGNMAQLQDAVTVNRGVLEGLLRLMIQKGVVSRDEAMALVNKKK